MEVEVVFAQIVAERNRQDAQHGGKVHDEGHSSSDWLRILDQRMVRIGETLSDWPNEAQREAVTKLAAVAVAWLEVQ